MSTNPNRFQLAIERFDALNAQDPNVEIADGVPHPKELLYAQRMSEWLDRFAPDAPEPLRLAARCQHILRWHSPRSSYPMDRAGYHRWRTDLAKFHADTAGRVLREVGYDDATIARVQSLVRKERLKADPDAQTLEDVICLVFLQYYFADFSEQHDEAKLIGILKRTWAKMSPKGRKAALALDLPREKRLLIEKALAPSLPE
ncbi:MAG TPA: DUF4202 domain-containing protein [Tepidisphaeraceae bacterium]